MTATDEQIRRSDELVALIKRECARNGVPFAVAERAIANKIVKSHAVPDRRRIRDRDVHRLIRTAGAAIRAGFTLSVPELLKP